MEQTKDPFPSSLPKYDSPVRIFDLDITMTEAANGEYDTLDSPGALSGDTKDSYYSPAGSQSTRGLPTALASFSGPNFSHSYSPDSSVQDSSSDSKRNSTAASSESSRTGGNGVDINMAESNPPMANGGVTGADPVDDENRLFDFESAASSPGLPNLVSSLEPGLANGVKMPYRSFRNQGLTKEIGPSARDSKESCEASPSLGLEKNEQSWPAPTIHPSYDLRGQYVSGSVLNELTWSRHKEHFDPSALDTVRGTQYQHSISSMPYATPVTQSPQALTMLYIDPLPLKSRVETQIPVRLTLSPIPPGINSLHLQTHTISKSKLVMRPTPEKAADMLELFATLTCTSAMYDPIRRSKALARAAGPPLLPGVEDDKALDVRICRGCIERERKRSARKKTKNVEEEELWQKDEAKRTIVFNTHEVKEWQRPSVTKNGELTKKVLGHGTPSDTAGAMQVDLPMRIACYCRHQEEKTGFQVIFTIKDHQDQVVAQQISNSIIITDDHKTHGVPTATAPHTVPLPEQRQSSGPGYCVQVSGVRHSHGHDLNSNRAFSTNDLIGMQDHHDRLIAKQPNLLCNSQDTSQTTSATLTPRNLSRQASPSGPSSVLQNKRRKGSTSGSRIRNDLMMTKLQTATSPHRSQTASSSTGDVFPFRPNYAASHGLSMPSIHPEYITNPPTPNTPDGSLFSSSQRSYSMENLQNLQDVLSAPTSVRPSRAPSPSVAANSSALIQAHAQLLENSLHAAPDLANARNTVPTIHKLTPGEGPRTGGIEVTCLGAGFRKDLEVVFGDALATTTTYWGESALVCLVPPAVRAGIVPVTLRHNNHHGYPSPPGKHVYFRYVDDDEQELMKHALTILNRQWTATPMEAGDFARQILSFNSNLSVMGASTLSPQLHNNALNSYESGLLDVEALVLRCLETIDLDDSPGQISLNTRGCNGQGMLHLSASLGYYRLVCALLARGAHPDLRDHNGLSPLHMACLQGHTRIIRKLRSSGADPTLRSLNGFTPTDMAASPQAQDAINSINQHQRSRSTRASPMSRLCRTNSQPSVRSLPGFYSRSASGISMDRPPEVDGLDHEIPLVHQSQPMTPSHMWARSRRNSKVVTDESVEQPRTDSLTPGVPGYISGPVMSAWRDQLSAQIQQLQQSVHRALPPIPTLPDYQTHPVVRRISSLVPQRSARPGTSHDNKRGAKEADYHWWELLTGATSSPPPYEEIYPPRSRQRLAEIDMASLQAAGETLVDKKCEALYDQADRSSTSDMPNVERSSPGISLPEHTKGTHAQKVKRLRSDRNLFFIWIPLLVLVIVAVLRDRAPHLWHAARPAFSTSKGVELEGQ